MYLLITFVISWGCWFTVAAMHIDNVNESPFFALYVLGIFGPPIAAFATKIFYGDKIEFKQFLKQFVRVKVNIVWYLWIAFMPLVIIFLPWLVNFIITGKQQLIIQQPLYMILALIPAHIIGGGLEEPGWRGMLLPELLKKLRVSASICIISAIWAIWHIPLWFIKGSSQYGTNFPVFAAMVLSFNAILCILYIQTKSILLCILIHSLMNSFLAFFSSPCTTVFSRAVYIAAQLLIVTVILIAFSKRIPDCRESIRKL